MSDLRSYLSALLGGIYIGLAVI